MAFGPSGSPKSQPSEKGEGEENPLEFSYSYE
jgi:hypothetical protein